jgi:hypothetical protein
VAIITEKKIDLSLTSKNMNYLLWALYILFMAWPAISPLGLPFPIGEEARTAYQIIEDLPSGSVVLYSEGGSIGGWSEIGPGAEAIFQHIMEKDLKIIFLALGTQDGPIQVQYMLNKYSDLVTSKEYGVDYVELGYLPGGVAAAAAIAEDFREALNKDYHGNQIDDLPLMEEVFGAEDVDLIITMDNTAETEYYVTQWWAKYNSKIIVQTMVMMYSWLRPYRDAGQVVALLSGMRGGAEYELLIDNPGEGVASTDMVSLTHVAMIILIILSNIQYIMQKRGEEL